MESLESRVFLAFNPTPQEQELLELVNRMRMNPAAELDLLLNAKNADIQAALKQYSVNMATLRAQWEQLAPVPPVAWNSALYRAARGHTEKMIEADKQSHQLHGELSLRDRVDSQGYDPQSYLGENVYAYATSPLHAHAAFAIDWGPTPSGIQRPPGHRTNMMDVDPAIPMGHREVGIGIMRASGKGRDTGPLVVTEDFGAPLESGRAFLLGTVRWELNGDGRYNAGEGLGGVNIRISDGVRTYATTTLSAGAYQLRLPAGTYSVTASGGGLASAVMQSDIVVDQQNVKTDFLAPADAQPPRATLVSRNVRQPSESVYRFKVTYRDNALLRANSIGSGDIKVTGARGFQRTARLVSRIPDRNAASISAVYSVSPPGGEWDARDNGTYTVKLVANEVRDFSGNAAGPRVLGTFRVNIGGSRSVQRLEVGPMRDATAAPIAAERASLFNSQTSVLLSWSTGSAVWA